MKQFSYWVSVSLCGLSLACVPKISSPVSDAVHQAERATEVAPGNPEEDRALAEHLAELLVALPYVDSVSEREKEMFEYRFATIARQHDPAVNLNLRGCVSAATTVAEAEECFRGLYSLGRGLVHSVTSEDSGEVETSTLEPFKINLAGSAGSRVLRMQLSVEASPAAMARMDARLPMIRHEILMRTGEYSVLDLEGVEGKESLQADIEACINEQIVPEQVHGVYFLELLLSS